MEEEIKKHTKKIFSKDNGAADPQFAAARSYHRKSQFYLDIIESENSMGFHAPEEALRILGESINYTRMGQLALRDAIAKNK